MDGARENFLPGPALAPEEYGRIRRRSALCKLYHLTHRGRLAEHEAMARLDLAAKDADVAPQAPSLQRFFDHVLQLRRLERLLNEVVCARLHGADCSFDAAVRGDDDDQRTRRLLGERIEHAEAGDVGHL